jgi:hypothetical protein
MPLNNENEDFHPDMVDLPPERKSITSIALCLIWCEVMKTLRKFSIANHGDMRWEALFSSNISLAKKDNIISQIDDRLERKFLRHCDPSDPLHTFVSIIIRSSTCKPKLFAHNPRQFVNSHDEVPQSERSTEFVNTNHPTHDCETNPTISGH